MPRQRVIVIGAGVGGLSAAAILASRGEDVLVLERSDSPGGKLRQISIGGRGIDAGPTVFTMKWVFDELFDEAGDDFASRIELEPATVLARHAWNADRHLDLFANPKHSADAIGSFAGAAEAARFSEFCREARNIYETLKGSFLQSQRPDPVSLTARAGVLNMLRINPFEKLWSALTRHFGDSRLRQLFGRYATYCGSSPFEAPATLMLIAHVEQEGVWLISGGMVRLATALESLCRSRGAAVRYGGHVAEIAMGAGRVTGVRMADGEFLPCSDVILNADVNALAEGLLGNAVARAVPPVERSRRSLSAVTWCMLAEPSGFPLIRHNVFFSNDYAGEFRELARGLPSDPTVYVCAQDRGNAGQSQGTERIFCLVNAPPDGDLANPVWEKAEPAMRRRLAGCGLTLRGTPQDTVMTTPAEFARMYPATGGALYGRASQGWSATFRRPASATSIPGLYLAGGSVHPGPGIPMAALSGRLAAERLLASRISRPLFRGTAIAGGTLMP
jgi:1-hydroxycarotenoid 3,4-desaturase